MEEWLSRDPWFISDVSEPADLPIGYSADIVVEYPPWEG